MDVKTAAIQVLQQAGTALHAKDIAEQIMAAGLWQSEGKTPDATVSARLYSDIKNNGDNSPFVKVGLQTFALRDSAEIPSGAGPVPVAVEEAPKPSPANAGFSFANCAQKVRQSELCDTSEDAAPLLKKVHKPGKATPDPIHGLFEAEVGGRTCVVKYESDTALRDSEQVPLLEEGGPDCDGIGAFFRREVQPFTPDAWIDPGKKLVATKSPSPATFTGPRPCAPSMRSRPISTPWSRRPKDLWNRLSGRLSDDLVSYPEYKDSGQPFLGDIPAHWNLFRNGCLFSVNGAKRRSKNAEVQ